MKDVSDTSFKADVLEAKETILVDFWAPWCMPCKQLAPILDEIDKADTKKVQIVKINTEENPQTPSQYGIRGVPTLMIFKKGVVTATKVGALPKNKLLEWIDSNA